MRFEPRRAFIGSRLLPFTRPLSTRSRSARADDDALPPHLAFLRSYRPRPAALRAAVVRARAEGVGAAAALLAHGAVSEPAYYHDLADHLGLPYVGSWPELAAPVDVTHALAHGRVRLAGANPVAPWLLAPTGPALDLLLRARRLGLPMPDVAVTTPSHLATILVDRARASLAHGASERLPERAPHLSAKARRVGAAMFALALAGVLGLIEAPACRLPTTLAFGGLFFAGTVFRLLVCAAGWRQEPRPAPTVPDAALPFYSVLVPLHDEAAIVPHLLDALGTLDYPRSKLEVLILVEAHDLATREALTRAARPAWLRVVVVPDGWPRTKPRALNVGLTLARGTLLTVYDAEDRPDPDQLRRAAERFHHRPELACLQARLAIGNGGDGLLARLFAVEYAGLFDLFNIGIARCRLPMALGGTSNHVRVAALRAAGGWDAWNVTEDADLGLRLARLGLPVDALDSTTLEEAVTTPRAWLKQRRRWTKGWMQCLLVLAHGGGAARDLGPRRAIAVALLLVNLVVGPLLLPAFGVLLVADLAVSGLPSPHGPVELGEATLAASVLVLGVGSTLWCGYAGSRIRALGGARRVLGGTWRVLPLMLPYQLAVSLAAWAGLWDLVVRPHHWHKTDHREAASRRRA